MVGCLRTGAVDVPVSPRDAADPTIANAGCHCCKHGCFCKGTDSGKVGKWAGW